MKKSTIFLLIAIGIAICWSMMIGLMAASTIINYMKGNKLLFVKTQTELMESQKITYPNPLHKLYISGEGTGDLICASGKELTVRVNNQVWAHEYFKLKNGDALIRFSKFNKYWNEIMITIPDIPEMSFDNLGSVTANGLKYRKLSIQGSRVYSFTANNCTMGCLTLDFPVVKDQQKIIISKFNQIDTLIACVKGFGNIRLETAGKLYNKINLSESMRLEANTDLVKKLALK